MFPRRFFCPLTSVLRPLVFGVCLLTSGIFVFAQTSNQTAPISGGGSGGGDTIQPSPISPGHPGDQPQPSPTPISGDPGGDTPLATGATIEWANVGTDWATNANWVGGTAPANSTTVNIASFGSQNGAPTNPNLASARSIAGITFLSNAFAYTIGGSTLTIGADGISNSATNTETFSNQVNISAGQTWTTNVGGTLILGGTVDLNATANTARTLTISGAGNTTFNGVIQNSFAGSTGNLTFNGSGTLKLAGNNTYTGATTISGGGTTLVNGNQSLATGAVSVTGTGTILGGTGTIGGAATLTTAKITGATNGTVGMLTLSNNLTFSGTGGYIVDISGATSDKLVIGGVLNLASTSDTISFSGTADGTTTYVLATYASETGIFNTVSGLPAGYQLVYGATELDLVPVPEPSTWVGGALALAVIGYSQRKRMSRLLKRAS